MTFTSRQIVRFAHVDAAGIVFYPRYFEMVNAAVEDFFAQAVGVSFADMHIGRRLGVPTARLEADFVMPSRLGEMLDFTLEVEKIGRSSATLAIAARCAGELRLQVCVVLVCMNLDRARPEPWPQDMRPGASEPPDIMAREALGSSA